MKKKQTFLYKIALMTLAAVMLASSPSVFAAGSAAPVTAKLQAQTQNGYYFNFAKNGIEGYADVRLKAGAAPVYDDETGYGFVSSSNAIPPREVDLNTIKAVENAFICSEKDETKFLLVDDNGEEIELSKSTTHNFGGMIFRVKAPAGAYKITVKTLNGEKNTIVSVSGMQATRIEKSGTWDAAGLVPIENYAKWNGNMWTYNYVNGMDYIDIELEPRRPSTVIGIKSIAVEPIEVNQAQDKPTVFTLGDSTLKSYIFEESPMCGWGQVFDDLFDTEKVNVINYSMGGRSLKQMYVEGRLNDILMTGSEGDYLLIQSGHNDERNGTKTGTADGETARFGGGATEEMYETFLKDIYIPACNARGITPILVTPMSRINAKLKEGEKLTDSFDERKFPEVMREAAAEEDVLCLDLNKKSLEYYNDLGVEATKNIFMSLEAGETPGKTSSGSFANGHPDNKIDGTHFKEAMAKQFSRMLAEELYDNADKFEQAADIIKYLKYDVKNALKSGDWSKVYPEVCNDTITGAGSYYRNQIEKMVQLGVMQKDKNGNFNPNNSMTVNEYIAAISKLLGIDEDSINSYEDGVLNRETMAGILYDAYAELFGYTTKPNGEMVYNLPKYMTEYNKTELSPFDKGYNPNSILEQVQYYPLVGFGALEDTADISPEYYNKVKAAYNLGLIRSEKGIERGSMVNGILLEPNASVTRAKAAKSLYFMWVLCNPLQQENNEI